MYSSYRFLPDFPLRLVLHFAILEEMKPYTLTTPPAALRRKSTTLDNVALVPASLLPFRTRWQQLANELPKGGILICVPTHDEKPRPQFLAVARDLRDKGFTVRAVKAEAFSHLAK